MQQFELFIDDNYKKTITLSLEDVKCMLNMKDTDIFDLYRKNECTYYNGISFNEYLYLCTLYNFKDEELMKKYQKKISFIKPLVEYIGIKSKILENNIKVLKKVDLDKLDFIPNSSIIYEMYSGMNKLYDKEERLFYYYFKLIHLLNTNTKVNFLKMINRSQGVFLKKNFNMLNDININNNEVTCFEFTEILKYFMKQENVIFSNYNLDQYGRDKHVYLDIIYNNSAISFDAFTSDRPNDMINVKLGMKYKGIKIISSDLSLKDKANKVYEDVKKEFNIEKKSKYKNSDIKKIIYYVNNMNISILNKEKIKKLILKLSTISLTGTEYTVEGLIRLGDFYSNVIYPLAVCDTKVGYNFSLLVAIKQKTGEYLYIRLNDSDINIYTKKEIEQMIESNELIICNRRDLSHIFIPGIDEKIQSEGSLNAKKKILPKLIHEINNGNINNNDNKQKILMHYK